MTDELKSDFCIEIDFERGSFERPSRVFEAMAGLIEGMQALDIKLAQAIYVRLRPELVLEEIEAGSIRSWLRNRIIETDDEALEKLDYKKIIGDYLVKAKYRVLERLKDRDSLEESKVKELQGELQQLAEETKVRKIPSYGIVRRRVLAEFWIKTSESTAVLGERDVARYISTPGQIVLPKGSVLPDEIKEEILTQEISTSETVLLLKVKKPDYLGQSRWLFHYDGHPIEASIEDKDWLESFQNSDIIVRPGDSLKASLKTEVKKGFDKEDVSVRYYVTKVIDVVVGDKGTQGSLFQEDKPQS
ncbi:MAG TPA: hypothetical protein VMW84_04105 [Acidobacteriota bacterium]|nr:hypothetical protein [Acidobacteriota bacterium]